MKLNKCYIRGIDLYGAENLTLRKVDQKCLESFEMWCWRRMEKISWTDRLKSEEILCRVQEERNILHTIERKISWLGYILLRILLVQYMVK
jgi:hypothetical protein